MQANNKTRFHRERALIRRGAALALLLLPLLAPAQEAPFRVEISGAGAFESLLRDNLDIVRHAADAELGAEEKARLAAGAPRQIRELLATEGYFTPTVEYQLAREPDASVARYRVAAGEPTRIEAVEIGFSGAIKGAAEEARRERLRRGWKLKPGEVFRQADWTDAKNALLKELLVRDFPAARIADSTARIDPARRSAQLALELDSGPYFTFGELQIQGMRRYRPEIVTTLNPIRPGEPFSQEKLNELQSRVQDTGYFRAAFATIEVDRAHPERVPVRLDLSENERRRLDLGIGFSTDAGPRLQTKWLDRDFLERGWRLDSALRIDRDSRALGADVLFPALKNRWRPSVGAHFERTDIAGELNDKLRFDARLTSPHKENERMSFVSYLADRQRLADGTLNNRQALIVGYSITRRRLDNLVSPTRGHVLSAEADFGPPGLLNERTLVRGVAAATWLQPFGKRWSALVRGRAGQVFGASRATVPADLLFRAGGDQSVRGYAFNSLGVADGGAIVGGRVLAVASAELVYQITPQWGAALFTDAGNAADTWRDFRAVQGSGVGARWRSPIGPINLDLAYAHETRKPRLHFSVGYGF